MPGAVMMENGARAPLHTNHDRDHGQFVNGNGPQATSDRQNGILPGDSKGANANVNGTENIDGANSAQLQRINTNPSRMNDLPDEIQHVTMGFVPMGTLLSRLAQKTHNQLADHITALSKLAIPTAALNGNSTHAGTAIDDTSPENLQKKANLLNFIQEKHAEWVKVAVITRWSRNASNVSKLIDLMGLLRQNQAKYSEILDLMIFIRQGLTFARLPNPDLKTAHYVLSTGTAPWMPDVNYIEPPPLTPKEQLQWIENLNTLLFIRLNLEDYDSLPYQFRDYTIDSGRVTFKVPGEFEVDLTIADEDSEKQFWFIDFRFAFTPAPAELSYRLRMNLEAKVNETLGKDGLGGCYKLLHEFVLTHKITEYVRQALELSKTRWVGSLHVERLQRAMAIQYWVGRYPSDGPKSWIILGVHSGNKDAAPEDPKSASHLTLRWFKEKEEMKDIKIPFNDADISTEDLLNSVIGRHSALILGSIYSKLKSNGRFTKREAGLTLDLHKDDPTQSFLRMQLGYNYYVTVRISSATGTFSLKPPSGITFRGEQRLNWPSKEPIQDYGATCLESVRCHYVVDEINRRGKSTGWFVCKGPVKIETVKEALKLREMGQLMWLKRRGWTDQWYLMVNLSLSGDKWWLMEINHQPDVGPQIPSFQLDVGPRITSYTSIPLSSHAPNLEDKFFSNLTIFTAALISQLTDLRNLHKRKVKHTTHDGVNYSLPTGTKIPAVFIRLSDILKRPQSHGSQNRSASWARDFVQVVFKGVRNPSSNLQISDKDSTTGTSTQENPAKQQESLQTFLDARLKVSDPSRFALLEGHVERDVAFNPRLGVFALRLEAQVGSTMLDTLAHRLQAIDKLADCIDAIRRSDRDIQCEEITLTKVVVSYTDQLKSENGMTAQPRWKATLDLGSDTMKLSLEKGNPQLRVLDHFQHLINSELRCLKLPFYLSSTLPIQRALDSVEDAWEDLAINNQGRVELHGVHLDWLNLHYYLPGHNRITNAQRRCTLTIKLRQRREKVEWHISRQEPGLSKQPDDEFKQALDKVFNAEDKGWHSLVNCASTTTDHRVGDLIRAIDEAIRRLAMQSPTLLKQNQPKGQLQLKNQAQAVYHKQMATKPRPQSGQIVVLDD